MPRDYSVLLLPRHGNHGAEPLLHHPAIEATEATIDQEMQRVRWEGELAALLS
jgi:hypothetical protein